MFNWNFSEQETGMIRILLFRNTVCRVGLVLCLWLCLPIPCMADIYKYVDEKGVIHFTNTPSSSKFKIYMKEGVRHKARPRVMDTKAYDPFIQKAASRYGVPFALVKSVIQVESAFNPAAVSPKGARGLMQIMPENDRLLSLSDPFDPVQNIMAGTRYLRQMLDRYQNNVRLALAAYNAGPGAVDRHQQQIPPFTETRDYVRKVLDLYHQHPKS